MPRGWRATSAPLIVCLTIRVLLLAHCATTSTFFCCLFATTLESTFVFLLIFCNMDPSVFAAAGTIVSPSSPNTNANASSPNINAIMLPSATTAVVIPSRIHSRSSTSNSPIPIIYFGICRWSHIWLAKGCSRLLMARILALLRLICPVTLLPPLPTLILALPKRFSHGNNKINSYSVLYSPPSPLMFFTLWWSAQLQQVFGAP